ncbi:hypothetical protein [Streptomyces bathyalis]|uniref:hypothetical protein n=1 Tax=Streptomyces bathyalis TaxID=2710756 RepID=UPI0018D06B16|nr:hypothetical protein [Streptomyces bathyalis]
MVHTIADIAAAFVGLWIVLYLLGADGGNLFVLYMEDMAYWIAGWSQNLFTVENEFLVILLNYVLPAVVYLVIGHGIAAKMRPGKVNQMDDATMRLTPANKAPREAPGWQPR